MKMVVHGCYCSKLSSTEPLGVALTTNASTNMSFKFNFLLASFPSHLIIPNCLKVGQICSELPEDGRLLTMASGRFGYLCSTGENVKEGPVILLNKKPERKFVAEHELGNSMGLQSMDRPSIVEVDPDHRSLVALIGKANVGKSMLLNQLLGEKLSIVTTKPQTTRHRIPGICSGPNYQMKLYDTPGIISKRMHKLDEMMVQSTERTILDADCLLIVADICKPPEQVVDLLEKVSATAIKEKATILVLNKKDLIKPGEIAKKREWYQQHGGFEEVLTISAKFGHGVEDLKKKLVKELPFKPGYFPRGILSEHPEKFFVAELVRENIYSMYHHEIPYSCQVNVARYHVKAPSVKDFIEVEILVEKELQKAVLIGKGGQMLKALARASRLGIQEFLRKEVYVEIKVRVEEDWRTDGNLLTSFGYGVG
ncbi:hypothetical protein O6H91_11G050000 [Diphasiastrum complanatum]|uniref:Uncharacterized protein n=1 Tax=Diphasiastrum complanatum TaxID=34168 RepID=A0ACC2C8V8_DIPCM|nr:hypothetical protein O6H91_11G050000 [Diphasiastrum complanatum]